jgi:hypothetical protein
MDTIGNNRNNYRTNYSKISTWQNWIDNKDSQKYELEEIDRNFSQDHDSEHQLPHLHKQKYNRVTRKLDTVTKPEVEDSLDMDDNEFTAREEDKKAYTLELENLDTFEEFETETQTGTDHSTSYMFFNNLELIHKFVQEMLTYDEEVVNAILDDGHNWAEDHMSVAKEAISHVRNYFVQELDDISESYEGNYMFFGNLVCISDMVEEILGLDPGKVSQQLKEKHDWAEDHISAAKENITQVYDFLKNEIK